MVFVRLYAPGVCFWQAFCQSLFKEYLGEEIRTMMTMLPKAAHSLLTLPVISNAANKIAAVMLTRRTRKKDGLPLSLKSFISPPFWGLVWLHEVPAR